MIQPVHPYYPGTPAATTTVDNPIVIERRTRHIWATWVSRLTNPPLLTGIAFALSALWLGTLVAWVDALAYGFAALIVPTLYVAWLVKKGLVTDLHLRIREQRTRPYLVAILCMSVGLAGLVLAKAPFVFIQAGLLNLVQTGLLMLITLRWKISAHTASAAAMTVWLWHMLGSMAWPALLLVPRVAWARLLLRRHDLGQVIGGAILGIAVAGLILAS